MKFKTKYKWQNKDLHFKSLKRARELKTSFEELIIYKTPFLDFFSDRFTGGLHWSDKDLSVISNSDGMSLS